MTKQELYDALKAKGVKLNRGANFFSLKNLQKMYDEQVSCKLVASQLQVEDQEVPEPEKFGTLEFESGGWCPELGRSYEKGVYLPRSVGEYNILKKYAKVSK